jgi:hypothetical protein
MCMRGRAALTRVYKTSRFNTRNHSSRSRRPTTIFRRFPFSQPLQIYVNKSCVALSETFDNIKFGIHVKA